VTTQIRPDLDGEVGSYGGCGDAREEGMALRADQENEANQKRSEVENENETRERERRTNRY